MKLSSRASEIIKNINADGAKLGDLRKIANDIKKDHDLAMELWSASSFHSRMLSILIMDRKQLDPADIHNLMEDIHKHPDQEKLQLTDWLMANQLTRDKKLLDMLQGWEADPHPLKRRIFWYHQGRLRWTGQKPPDNSERLLTIIENTIEQEVPEVQWAMNFLAGWIGVWDASRRKRCVHLGEQTGLFKGKMVSKGCTPEYLPEFIAIETAKRGL